MSDPGEDRAEIARLNKVVRALMDRAERSSSAQSSDFGSFQTTVLLEEQVRRRTQELENALRENERITRDLRRSEQMFRALANQSLVGIGMIDDGLFSYTNQKLDEIFGYSPAEMKQLRPIDLAVEGDRQRVSRNLRRRLSGEMDSIAYQIQGVRKDGGVIDLEIHGSVMTIDGKRVLITSVLDVTERVRAQRKVLELKDALRDQAVHDQLTGLYNRRYLEETLRRELVRARRKGGILTAIISDLDHFKCVNDLHGHLAGDKVLRVYGEILKSHARASDVYCRYGGEEFLLLMPDMPLEAALDRAETLRHVTAAKPVRFGTRTIPVTASFGVACYPFDAVTGDELITAADQALYAAKKAGRNRVASYATIRGEGDGVRLSVPTPVLLA